MRQTAVVRQGRRAEPGWLKRLRDGWERRHGADASTESAVAVTAGGRFDDKPRILLGVVVAGVLAAQSLWLILDSTPMAFVDSYAYLSRLLRTMHALADADRVGEVVRALELLSLNGRPPLYQLLAMPGLALVGKTEDVAALVNMLFLALGGLAAFRLGGLAGSRRAGVLAALLFLTYPPVVALNHEFLPHAIVPTLIVTTLWNLAVLSPHAAPSRPRRSLRSAVKLGPGIARGPQDAYGWLLAAQLTFGALIHPSYLGMVSVPVLGALVFHVGPGFWSRAKAVPSRGSSRLAGMLADRSLRSVWLPAGLSSSAIVATWYLGPGAVIVEKYIDFKGAALAVFRRQQYLADGFRDQAGPWWYWETATAALSKPLAILGTIAVAWTLVWTVLGALRARTRERRRALGVRGLILLSFGWIVLVIHLGETAFAWWKMAPALPLLALLTALAVFDLPHAGLRYVVSKGLAAVCIFNLLLVLFGRPWGGNGVETGAETVARLLGARLDSDTCRRTARHACVYCPQPPRREVWPGEDFVAAVRRQSVTDEDPGNNEIMIVGGPLIRPALFSFWLAKHWPEHGYRIRGTGYMNWGYPYNLRALLETRFILFAPQPVRKRDKAYVPTTLSLLMKPPPTFARAHQEIATFPLRVDPVYRSVTELRLLRRVEALTVAEAKEVIERLDLAPEYLSQAPELLEEIRTGDRVHLRGRRR